MAIWTLVEGVANVALSVYLGRHYGTVGVALGTAIPMAVTAIFVQPPYVLRLAGVRPLTYVGQALARPASVGAAFMVLCGAIPVDSPDAGVAALAWTVLWQGGIFVMLAFAFGISPEDRRFVVDRCRRLAVSLGRVRAAGRAEAKR
jgi:O-antigen/teichoic acid export membrane protein